jgi:hypothetical protein
MIHSTDCHPRGRHFRRGWWAEAVLPQGGGRAAAAVAPGKKQVAGSDHVAPTRRKPFYLPQIVEQMVHQKGGVTGVAL